MNGPAKSIVSNTETSVPGIQVTYYKEWAGSRFGNCQPSIALGLIVRLPSQVVHAPLFAEPGICDVLAPLARDREGARWHGSISNARPNAQTAELLETFAQMVSAIQESAGFPLSERPLYFSPVKRPTPSVGYVVDVDFPSIHPAALAQVLPATLRFFNAWLCGEKLGYEPDKLKEIVKQLSVAAPKGQNTRLLLDAAYRLDVPVIPLVGQTFQLGWGARSRWIESSFTDRTSGTSARLARDKRAANCLLRQNGLPVADQYHVQTIQAARRVANEIGYPLVLKPADLDGGIRVFAGVRNDDELQEAFTKASEKSGNLIIETQLPGNDYRLGIVNGQLAWATYREPAGVHGDGVSSISALIAQINRDPRRGTQHWSLMRPIRIDDEARSLLKQQKFTMRSVPEKGRFVRLRYAANISAGGTPSDIRETVHPDNAQLAIRAARIFRLDIAGVDLITPDITKSWKDVGGGICEINGQPQFTVSRLDAPFEVVGGLIEGDGRIPVVAFLGAVDQAILYRLSEALASHGMAVAVTTPESATIGSSALQTGDMPYFDAVQLVLRDPAVDALVLAEPDEQWLSSGLPFDKIDFLIAHSNTDSHLKKLLSSITKVGVKPFEKLIEAGDAGIDVLAEEIVALRSWHNSAELPTIRVASSAVACSPYRNRTMPTPGTIGLCMIAKNEAHIIRRSLESVKHLVDYVLVEDTGSTDNTKAVVLNWLRETGIAGAVLETPWRDFAWNRTRALAHLRSRVDVDYAFVLDADDIVEFDAGFNVAAFRAGLTFDVYDVLIKQANLRFPRPHFCRNSKSFGYRGVLHEYLEPPANSAGHGLAAGISINVKNQGARSQNSRKYQDDAACLQHALKRELDPDLRARYTFYLAQSCQNAGELVQAQLHYAARASMGGWNEEVFVACYQWAKIGEKLGHLSPVVERAYLDAIAACPSRAEGYHGISRHYRLNKRFREGREMAQLGILKGKPGRLFMEQWIYNYGLLDELAVNAFWAGNFDECAQICRKILQQKDIPELFAARVRRNLTECNQRRSHNHGGEMSS